MSVDAAVPVDTALSVTGSTPARTGRLARLRARRPASARLRILSWLVFLVAVADFSTIFLQRQVLLRQLDEEVGAALNQEAEEIRALARTVDPASGQPLADDPLALLDAFFESNIPLDGEALLGLVDGRVHRATPAPYRLDGDPELSDRWAALTTVDRGEQLTPAGPVRYVAVPLDADGESTALFVAATFLQEERREIERAAEVGLAVFGTVLAAAMIMAWLVAGRVLAPVRAMTQTARRLTGEDLGRRIPPHRGNDEIAELGRTFNAMMDRLERAFTAQRQFLSDVGHELRTPLTIVRGNVELLGDDPVERQETRALILDELDDMARTVDDLLLLARAEQPDFVRLEDVELDRLAADLLVRARAVAVRDWRLQVNAPGTVRVDRRRLTQAVMNLVDNAARHTRAGDRITIGAERDDGRLRLWVQDSGPGVSPADQAVIFERFSRAADPRGRPGSAGLGLAIVKAVAGAHGGSATVESRPGDGARFTLTLPDRRRERP